MRAKAVAKLIVASMAGLISSSTTAQGFPAKPVKILTQFGAGAPGDVLVRFVASRMSGVLGQPVVVENRTGGNGMVAVAAGVRALPDGYTLLALSAGVPVVQAVTAREMSFDPEKDLLPITLIGDISSVIVVGTASPAKSLKDLIEQAKSGVDKISYGTTGIGSQHHLAAEQIRMLTGADWVHVPYKTAPLPDAMSGALGLAYAVTPQALPMVKAGKLRVLALLAQSRSTLMPEVPVVTETVPGFEVPPSWAGLFGPAGLPPVVLRRLHESVVTGLGSAESRDRVQALGYDLNLSRSPDEFRALLARQIQLVDRIVKTAKISLAD